MEDILMGVPATAGIELDSSAFKDWLEMQPKKWSEITYEEQQRIVWRYIQRENGFDWREVVL